jgi:tetratricopeptide (TPR) repeat protein
LHNLAETRQAQGRTEEARSLFLDALDRRRSALGESHPHVVETLLCLGNLARDAGRPDDALRLYGEALRIGRIHYVEGHFRLEQIMAAIAEVESDSTAGS